MRFRLALLIASVLGGISCGSVTSPSNNVTDTFSGTLEPRGLKIHPFSVSATGEVSVKITSLQPNPNLLLGTAVGQPQSDGACAYSQRIFPSEFAAVNIVSVTGPIEKGSWCVAIYDPLPGRLAVASAYTLTVSHP